MQLMPEAYRNQPALENHQEIVDFYNYFSALQEPWDGPALIVYSDGRTAGAILDRNGLRPARYSIYKDGSLTISSEAGVFDVDSEQVEKRSAWSRSRCSLWTFRPERFRRIGKSNSALLQNILMASGWRLSARLLPTSLFHSGENAFFRAPDTQSD